jgi:hypothetical protein
MIAATALAVIGGFLPPDLIIDNVVAQERDRLLFRLNKPALVLPVAALVGATAVLMNLERALRGSSGINRWKMKFMLLGIGVLFVVRIYTNTQAIVYGTIDSALDIYINGSLIVGSALILVSLFRSKSSIATIYPSQEIIYKSFTLLLVGLYVLLVGVLAEVVTWFGGVAAFPLKAFCILLATVGLAALFLSERVRYRSRPMDQPSLQATDVRLPPRVDDRERAHSLSAGRIRIVPRRDAHHFGNVAGALRQYLAGAGIAQRFGAGSFHLIERKRGAVYGRVNGGARATAEKRRPDQHRQVEGEMGRASEAVQSRSISRSRGSHLRSHTRG